MTIRITGMNSNLDTDSIIKELVKASSEKKTKMEKAQTKLSWKQDAWKEMNAKIKSFHSKFLDELRFSGNYRKKTTTISDDKYATVSASEKAVNGTQSVSVDKLAEPGYLTGGKLITKDNSKAGTGTKLSDLGAGGMNANGASISVTVNGKTSVLEFSSDSTIQNVIDSLNSAGINANFDADNQRIFINSADSGKDNDFSLTANTLTGIDALANLGLLSAGEIGTGETVKWKGYVGATPQATLANLTAAGEITKREEERAAQIFQNSKDRIQLIKDLKEWQGKVQASYVNSGMKSDMDGVLDDSYIQGILAGKASITKEANLSAINTKEMQKGVDALQAEYDQLSATDTSSMTQAQKDQIASNITKLGDGIAKLSNAMITAADYQSGTKDIADNTAALADNATRINELQLNPDGTYSIKTVPDANGDPKEVTKATVTNKLTNEVEKELVDKADAALALSTYNFSNTASGGLDGAVRKAGADAEITLNGAKFTSSTNTFKVNGLTIVAKELTNGSKLSVTTADDTDGIYNMIKDFITGYNSLVKEMENAYNAKSSKGYEPLSDEEKESLSDSEIEKWEDKIKDSILRRDTNLGGVVDILKNAMLGSYTVDGREMTLATFGIETMGYFDSATNERGVYYIDGEKDASKSNTLKNMIASDPKAVGDFFSQLTDKMYTDLNDKMKSLEGVRSYGNFYDDKKMQTEYDDYTKKIKAQEKKLKALEDKYYNQFSVMETALAKLQNNTSAITAMLGG